METFIFNTLDALKAKEGNDGVIIGHGVGRINLNDVVTIANPGVDGAETFEARVKDIRISIEGKWEPVSEAANGLMSLQLEDGMKHTLRRASVAYMGEVPSSSIHDAYITALGNAYVLRADLNLTDNEIESLTLTDTAELVRLFNMYHKDKAKKETAEEKEANRKKLDRVYQALIKKLMNVESIYAICSVDTGEPFLFSKTIRGKNGYMCSPANIRLIPVCYYDMISPVYPAERYEIKLIENGSNRKGIYNFLGDSFYLNGADGVEIIADMIGISAGSIIAPPDYTGMDPIRIPVTNPNLTKWLLLSGQMGEPKTDDEKVIYMLYENFIEKEVLKAKFIVPMKSDAPFLKNDNLGEIEMTKESKFVIATQKGKNERHAVRMYTDWKQFHKSYGNDWGGLIQKAEEMISSFDLAINVSSKLGAGIYVSDEMYERMLAHKDNFRA